MLIGPFPDPISGVSIANKVVKELLSNELNFSVGTINTSNPNFDEDLGKFSFKKFFFYLKLNLFFFKIFKYDVIYMTPGQTFYGVLKYAFFIVTAFFLKKEMIIHVHGNFLGKEYSSLSGFKRKLFHFLISRFTKGIVLSDSLKQNLSPFLKEEVIYSLPNFAQDYLYKDDKKLVIEELRIFYLSNLMKEKGILILLKALNILERNNIHYRAKIAGNIDQKYSKKISELLNGLKNTEYIGVVDGDKKKNLLNWGNVFVLPTFYKMEGQPITILEAMATKNLIITTNHAGISDIFKDQKNGFFVEKNNVDSIQKILSYIAENKNQISKIANYNQAYFLNNFTLKKFKKNLVEIMNE